MSIEILRDNIERRWNEGARIWDPAMMANVYAENAVFHGGRQAHSVGRAAIAAYFGSYSSELRGVALAFAEQEIRTLSPSMFAAQGFGDFRIDFRSGRRTTNRLRTSLVVVHEGGEWSVLLHHFSSTPDAPPLGH